MTLKTNEAMGISERAADDPVLSESDFDQFRRPFRNYQCESETPDAEIETFANGWLARGMAVMSWNSKEQIGDLPVPEDLQVGETWIGPVTTSGTKVILPSRVTKTESGQTLQLVGVLVEVHEGVSNRVETARMIADAINMKMELPKREMAVSK